MKNNKKKMNPQKRVQKLIYSIVTCVASDYILTNSEQYAQLLRINNQEAYITNDFVMDFSNMLEMLMLKSNLSADVRRLLGKIGTMIAGFESSANQTEEINNIIEVLKQFKAKVTVKEYFLIVRKLSFADNYTDFIAPLFMVLDFLYSTDIIIGEDTKGIITKHFTGYKYNTQWDIISCLFGSIDNIAQEDLDNKKICKWYIEYMNLTNVKIGKTITQDIDLDDLVFFQSSIAKYYLQITCLNKFYFDNKEVFISQEQQQYACICNVIQRLFEKIILVFRNSLQFVPTDVFTRRKYILRDTLLKGLGTYIVVDTEGTQVLLKDFHICEKCIKDGLGLGQDLYMIYVSYTVNGYAHTLPLCIDNFTATVGGFSSIDFFVFYIMLVVYGVDDYVDEDVKQLEFFKNIVETFKPIMLESTQHEKISTKGYKQNKEVHVDAFVRRLPKGQHASANAKELAKKYRVTLSEDFTLVSEYTKNKQEK